MERRRQPEMPLILRRSGTQYVAMLTKLWTSYCGVEESYCKESNISDTNWLIYLFSSYLIKIWSSIWCRHLANLHIIKTWISLERKGIFEKIKLHFSPYTDYFFVLKAWIRKVPFSSYSTTVSLKFAPSLMMTSHCKPGCPLARGLWLCVLKLDGMRANTLLVFSRTYMWYEPCYI